ncbi:MAG: ROK family protein [Flaviflexus sp.]|nr:ROK family protein [Flaviflexus sp.]
MHYSTVDQGAGLEARIVACLEQESLTRSQLCERLGVSRTNLGRGLAPLLAGGTIRAEKTSATGRGRPVERLILVANAAYGIGIDIARSQASGIITDRGGATLASATITYESFSGWRSPLRALAEELTNAARRSGVDTDTTALIGIGLPLPVPPGGGEVAGELAEVVAHYWDAPVLVDNAVRMAALGEARWGAGREESSQLYIRLSGGVGGCAIVADTLAGGAAGRAGELGHIQVAGCELPCQCGKTGCLETLASAPALCRAAGVADLDELASALMRGDERATAALDRAAGALGEVMAGAVLLLGPALVILGGEVACAVPSIVTKAGAAMRSHLIGGIDAAVLPAEQDAVSCARGAVAAAEAVLEDAQ